MIRVYDPTAEFTNGVYGAVYPRRLETLHGKTLGILSNGWRSFHFLVERYGEIAVESGARRVISRKYDDPAARPPREQMTEILAASDAVIVGLGN